MMWASVRHKGRIRTDRCLGYHATSSSLLNHAEVALMMPSMYSRGLRSRQISVPILLKFIRYLFIWIWWWRFPSIFQPRFSGQFQRRSSYYAGNIIMRSLFLYSHNPIGRLYDTTRERAGAWPMVLHLPNSQLTFLYVYWQLGARKILTNFGPTRDYSYTMIRNQRLC